MNKSASFKFLAATAVAVDAVCAGATRVEATTYLQTDLVSDIPCQSASKRDPPSAWKKDPS